MQNAKFHTPYSTKNKIIWKFIIPTTLIVILVSCISMFIIAGYVREQIRGRAHDQMQAVMEQVIESLNVTNALELEKVHASMRVLMREGLALGIPTLGESVSAGTELVQNLLLGNKPQANNFVLVDHVKSLMGGTATLFVKRGNDFVRVSTNVMKDDGSRAVGTLLDPKGKAIAAVREGKAFYGQVDLLGKPYITGYEPMYDKNNVLIGVWYVGYPVASFSHLGDIIAGTRILDHGFIALVDDHGNVRFKSKDGSGDLVEKIVKDTSSAESGAWNVVRKPFEPWGFQVVAAYPVIDITKRMSKAMVVVILFGLAITCFLIGALFFLVRKIVISPLRAIGAAATGISEGDLSFAVNVKSNDELGRLSSLLSESFRSLGRMLQRLRELSERISGVTEEVEKESRKVVRGSEVEAEAITNISHAVGELNATAMEIAESTEGLAASVEETSASIAEMLSSINNVNTNIHELTSAVETTSSSIEELSATIKEVASNSAELAETSEETLSAVSEITSAIKEVELNAKESSRLSEKVTNDAATFGMSSVEKTLEGMRKIKASVEHTAEFIKRLGGRSDEIGKILTVIDEITDQTTLLALNAAILAAQAGEHGKGFSVVADEIKDLAERTAFSTQEIASLIQSVQQEVKNAVDAMHQGLRSVEEGFNLSSEAETSLKKILDSSKRSSEMTLSIERATAEQSKAAKLVSEAVERVRDMTEQTAKATAEESKGVLLIMKAIEKMKDAALEVNKATEEQSMSSRQISQSMEFVAERSRQIARSLSEQKMGTTQILNAVEGVKGVPVENRTLAFRISSTLENLHKDSELLKSEMERFKFSEEKDVVLKFGVVPLESPAVMSKKLSPLVEYLSKKLGKKVELKVALDFEGAMRDIGENMTQVCYMTPSTYVDANRRYNVKVLVKALRAGKPYHHSVIITRADSNITSVGDLRGRTFAFGDMKSTSSHIIPRSMLRDAGIDIEDLQYYNYLGHHDDVARAVIKGDFDAGGVMESIAYRFKDQGIRFLQLSDEIPEFNICYSNSVDERDLSIMKTALISLNSSSAEGAEILKSIDKDYTGFVEADDSDYDGIRQKMAKLEIL